ncbi:hypothetical protein KC354_g9319 [Hortaea werneckii]|nr:hypothetical protein KC354_g9319 [Hortaea werneckii]KAI7476348.1 hypothetical protein KC351_g9510 [Hortaea werneckii]
MKHHKAPPALKNIDSKIDLFEADSAAGRRNSWGQEVQNARPSLQTLLPRISASHEDLIAAHDAEGKVVLYRCPKVYKRTLTALRPSPQPSSSGRLSFRASEEEKIVREDVKEVVYTQEGTDQRGRYRGAVDIEATVPRSHPLCELAGVFVGDLQAKVALAAPALAEEAHARNDDTIFFDCEPGMHSTLGSAEEPAELESREARSNLGYGEDAAWLGTFDDISESDALTWSEDTCACLVEAMGRMQAEKSSNDRCPYSGPSNGTIPMGRGIINAEETNQPGEVEEQQGSVNPIVDTQVSSTVSALVCSSTVSPSISRRASSIRPDSIAEGEALAEEHEKHIPYRLSMPRSSSAKLPTYTCYSPPLHRSARRTAS